MQNNEVDLTPDIENYVRSQSKRVMGISPENLTLADLTTLTNRLICEHKLLAEQWEKDREPKPHHKGEL